MIKIMPNDKIEGILNERKLSISEECSVLKDYWQHRYEIPYIFDDLHMDSVYVVIHNIINFLEPMIQENIFFLFDCTTIMSNIEKNIFFNTLCIKDITDHNILWKNIFCIEYNSPNSDYIKSLLIDLIYKMILFETGSYISFSKEFYISFNDERQMVLYFKNKNKYKATLSYISNLDKFSQKLLYDKLQ